MTRSLQIRYVKRQDLDTVKWDECIGNACNGMVYACSFYLDRMARHWDALVWNDYEAVMPLTWNKKWGIRYLYQPPMTQQLGVFFRNPVGSTSLPADLVEVFLAVAAEHFRFAEIFLNYKNEIAPGSAFRPGTRMNYVLPLGSPYPSIREQYSGTLLRNLAVAAEHSLHYTDLFDYADAITVYHRFYRERLPHVREKDYDNFLEVCRNLVKEGGVVTRAVFEDKTRKQLLSVSLLLKKNKRLYLILPATLPEGKTKHANPFLLDQLIREFSGQDLLLDFEGSDISGIARFYKKFGPQEQPYFFWRFNHLPGLLKFFKK